ncbi:MAG: leucine-rich repeat protein [Prevotella sp.]|nr:leucine-rich repeat protein [Alistipes senegalensis]MCM1357288.1 leucine-rich repeat protein [Prevotella sp.]MCM1473135.1 leucine-rich repeat protein [Muribaculaceae bacterium]
MKKHNRIIAGVMAVCLAFGVGVIPESIAPAVSLTANAEEEYTYENLTYDFLEDGTIEITKCDESATEVVIPDEIDGIKITSIGKRTFYNCKKLTSINIPDSVTSIGESAFHYCLSLTSIDIPDSVTSISDMAFKGCSSLTSITILNPECAICNDKDTITNGYFQDSNGYNYNDFKGTIYGYENSTAQAYAEKCGYKFESIGKAPEKITITGDLNGDNEFNLSDVVILQKYILGASDTEISDWKQADLNDDGVLDIFDLCLMKKKLIEK